MFSQDPKTRANIGFHEWDIVMLPFEQTILLAPVNEYLPGMMRQCLIAKYRLILLEFFKGIQMVTFHLAMILIY